MKNFNEYSATPMLESAEGAEIPLAHEQCRVLILNYLFDLRIAKRQNATPLVQKDVINQPPYVE